MVQRRRTRHWSGTSKKALHQMANMKERASAGAKHRRPCALLKANALGRRHELRQGRRDALNPLPRHPKAGKASGKATATGGRTMFARWPPGSGIPVLVHMFQSRAQPAVLDC